MGMLGDPDSGDGVMLWKPVGGRGGGSVVGSGDE